MKRLWPLTLSVVFLLGCNTVISTKQISSEVETTRNVSCNKFGYCYSCLPGFDGKLECSFKLSYFCDGTATQHVMEADFEETHKSGNKTYYRGITEILSESSCN